MSQSARSRQGDRFGLVLPPTISGLVSSIKTSPGSRVPGPVIFKRRWRAGTTGLRRIRPNVLSERSAPTRGAPLSAPLVGLLLGWPPRTGRRSDRCSLCSAAARRLALQLQGAGTATDVAGPVACGQVEAVNAARQRKAQAHRKPAPAAPHAEGIGGLGLAELCDGQLYRTGGADVVADLEPDAGQRAALGDQQCSVMCGLGGVVSMRTMQLLATSRLLSVSAER